MYKKLGSVLLASTFSFSLVPAISVLATETSDRAQNPFIWADVPDNDVIRVGDAYYMTSTTMHMNPGVPIMKSYDLVNWKIVNYVYDVLDGDDEQTLTNGENEYGEGSWASSLRYHDGTYYIAFSSNSTGKTYIYQTEDIENGPWKHSTIDRLFHDMSLLFDDDDRVYMVDGSGDIHITELISDATAIKEGGLDKTIIKDASLLAGSNVGLLAEGAHIQKINGKYYVFLITWPTGGSRQELCFRADSIDGDYEGKVVLNYNGIAQGGIVDTPDGDWYGMLFRDSGPVGRMPYLVPVTWEDGWPIFGVDGKVPEDTGIKLDLSKTNIVSSDEFYQGSEKIGYSHTVLETSDDENSEGGDLVLDDPADGKELLKNGDFDDGIDDWEVNEGGQLSTTDDSVVLYGTHNWEANESGESSTTDDSVVLKTSYTNSTAVLKISNRKGTTSGPKQNLTGKLEAGKTYYFSAKVKYDALDSAPDNRTFNFTMQNGPDYRYRKNLGSKSIKKGEWGTISGTYTMPEDVDPDNVFIFIETSWTPEQDKNKDLMDFYVDDVSFVDMTVDANIIKNGEFDSDIESWEGTWAGKVKWNDDGVVHVYDRTRTGGGPLQPLSGKVKAGEKYKFSAKVKYDDGPDSKYFNYTIHTNGDTKVMGSANITKGEWGVIEGTYTIPDGADTSTDTYIFLETPWTANPDATNDLMDFYVDDVLLEPVSTGGSGIKGGENDYNGSNLGLVWQWNHNPDNNNWSLTDRDGYLRLTTGRKSTSILDARNTLTQRTFGPQCSGDVAIDVSNMKDGDYAGLAAFQFYYGTVGVKMEGNSKYIVMMRGSTNDASEESEPVEIARIPLDQEKVYLKIDFNYENNTNKAYFYYSLDGKEWNKMGGGFVISLYFTSFYGISIWII
ncbi:beta-xylosidase [Clostridium carnis]|uniref:Beta-xylosidase n=1 Tax=Clostridium carnis TaxID=1530 RepID=A0ABY6SZ52_9CLOT|nr:carbohydrate binding domain-containing protein [Clostridium carnis]VDG73945.1 beta-xylosidase [Clostridium carnis]